jgi:non-ribosomal peptide synthetase-like protein
MTASIISLLLLLPFTIAASIAIKWILIGKYKEGAYPLWGGYYLRFWFVSRVLDLVPVRMMRGTPFLTIYYRLLGAKIGKNTFIGTDCFRVCDMVSIGDNSSVNADAHLMAYSISNGNLIIGKIDIGKNCVIGTRSVIGENTKIEDGAELGELSLLPSGTIIPKGEYWDGSPAEHNKNKAISPSQKYNALVSGTFKYYVLFSFAFIFSLFLPIMLLLPCIIAAFELYVNLGPFYTVLFTVPLSALYTILFCFSVALVKKILSSTSQKSQFSIYSTEYIKKWVVDSLVQLSLMTIQPVYATIYLPMWLRMLGAKVGKRAEISTVDHITAESLSLGEESFIADSASVGPSVVKHGFLFTGKTIIGKRTFIGNSALIPISCSIGENCLVGVLSKPPVECSEKIINDTNWLGSPPIVLPKRQDSKAFDSTQTYNPPFKMVLLRGCIEFLKITVPQALMSSCFITAYWFMSEVLGPVASLFSYICFCPVVILGCTLTVTLMTIILKWLIVGRYRKVEQPLWSLFIWKNEFINSLCENLVYPLLLQMIQGTLLLPLFFRLLGSKIGKNVYMETTEITEFDLVKIEDNASLNTGSTIQTHLFEDRVMKMSSLHIGKNVTIGPMSVVLYDSSMKEGAYLDGLSLLMKGEILPAETFWYGIPARSKKNSHQLKSTGRELSK